MSYYLAPSLKALGNEVTAAWPDPWPTVRLGDGWVGDTSHQARKSDHNPDWDAGGVVRAVDIGIVGRDADRILAAVIGDERVWYVIHKGVIYSRTYSWAPRAYTGSNPHNHHIHISIRHDRAAESDTAPWLTKSAPAQEDDMQLDDRIYDDEKKVTVGGVLRRLDDFMNDQRENSAHQRNAADRIEKAVDRLVAAIEQDRKA